MVGCDYGGLERTTLATAWSRRLSFAIFYAMTAWGVGGFLAIVVLGMFDASTGRVVFFVVSAIATLIAVRAATAEVSVSDTGVLLVRNPLTTRQVPVSAIVAITLGTAAGRLRALRVETGDGKGVTLAAVGPESAPALRAAIARWAGAIAWP